MNKNIWIIAGLAFVIFLVLNANPRFVTHSLPSIGIEKCECSESYNITCKAWLSTSDKFSCVYENPTDICGTCVENWSPGGGSIPTSSVKGP